MLSYTRADQAAWKFHVRLTFLSTANGGVWSLSPGDRLALERANGSESAGEGISGNTATAGST